MVWLWAGSFNCMRSSRQLPMTCWVGPRSNPWSTSQETLKMLMPGNCQISCSEGATISRRGFSKVLRQPAVGLKSVQGKVPVLALHQKQHSLLLKWRRPYWLHNSSRSPSKWKAARNLPWGLRALFASLARLDPGGQGSPSQSTGGWEPAKHAARDHLRHL